MKEIKLIQILKTFSKEDFKEFEKFVASPYFSRGRDLLPFYKVVKFFHPDFNNSNFTYEKIFRKLHPEENFDRSKSENILRMLSSELLKLAEEFIIVKDLRSNKFRSRICLMEYFLNNNLNTFFLRFHSDTMKISDNLSDGDTGRYFADLYYLKMLEVLFSVHNNGKVMSTLEAQISLFNFFFLCVTNFINNSHKSKINYNQDNKDDLAEQFMRNFDHENFISYLEDNKEIKNTDREIFELCFYSLLHTTDRLNENFIPKIEILFFKNRHLFRNNHKLSFYNLLKAAYDKKPDFEKYNRLYSSLLEDEVYVPLPGGEMPFMLYNDIFNNFIRQGKLDEAGTFILKYTDYLRTDKKDSFYKFGFAQIEFKRKNYAKALELVSEVEMLFFSYKFEIRNLYLKIYYELNYSEEAFSLIDSFKHFLKNNKNVFELQRMKYNKFIDYYRILLSIKLSGKKSDLLKIKRSVSNDNDLFNKDWLQEKIEEIF